MHTLSERLVAIRGEIDAVDSQLLALFNQRAALSLEVGRIKTSCADQEPTIFKPLREREVLDALEARNAGPLPNAHLRTIWREIFSSSRALQRPQKVAYLGPEGTFSYFAGVEYLGRSVEFQPCRDLHDVFRAVHQHECALGVVPLENSLQGTVGQSFDLFYTFRVRIQAELFSRISHNLLSSATSLAAVQRVYSHPQPLAQCDAWLRANLPGVSLIPVESTAAAARRATAEPGAAALGHASLADMLGLNTLAHAVEDEPGNWTRFVIIGPAAAEGSAPLPQAPLPGHVGANKTSLLFTLPDKPGSLSAVLESLASHKVNMRKLESRPLRLSGGECWKYVFFADVEADLEAVNQQPLVEELRILCNSFRVLGAYATGPQLDRAEQVPMVPTATATATSPCAAQPQGDATC